MCFFFFFSKFVDCLPLKGEVRFFWRLMGVVCFVTSSFFNGVGTGFLFAANVAWSICLQHNNHCRDCRFCQRHGKKIYNSVVIHSVSLVRKGRETCLSIQNSRAKLCRGPPFGAFQWRLLFRSTLSTMICHDSLT